MAVGVGVNVFVAVGVGVNVLVAVGVGVNVLVTVVVGVLVATIRCMPGVNQNANPSEFLALLVTINIIFTDLPSKKDRST